jgi:transposase
LQVNLVRKAKRLRKAKTDRSDAAFLARLVLSGGETKSYSPQVWDVSELRMLTRSRFRLVGMRSKYKQSVSRLISVLFPELPGAVWSVNQKSSYALLLEFPSVCVRTCIHRRNML